MFKFYRFATSGFLLAAAEGNRREGASTTNYQSEGDSRALSTAVGPTWEIEPDLRTEWQSCVTDDDCEGYFTTSKTHVCVNNLWKNKSENEIASGRGCTWLGHCRGSGTWTAYDGNKISQYFCTEEQKADAQNKSSPFE